MSFNLVLLSIIFSILMIIIIMSIVKRGRITIKYSLVWFFAIFIILLAALIPNFMSAISKILGFQTMSNMLICVLIAILIFICISLTIIVSSQRKKITLLIQEFSILKSRVDEYEKQNK